MLEFELLEALHSLFATDKQVVVGACPVPVGIGDDGAVLQVGGAQLAVSVDAQVEGVHFRRAWLSWEDVGFRALASAASDLAAMGAGVEFALLSVFAPRGMTDDHVLAVHRGVKEAAGDSMRIVGGNVSTASEFSISTTVMGKVPGAILRRSGAQVGDTVFVTGPVGLAGLGCAALSSDAGFEDAPVLANAVNRWRRPQVDFGLGPPLGQVATAAIDISDGLGQDLEHLCRASGVDAVVELNAVPEFEQTCSGFEALGSNSRYGIVNGGEDYVVLFTAPDSPHARALGVPIGVLQAGDGKVSFTVQGSPVDVAVDGFQHR